MIDPNTAADALIYALIFGGVMLFLAVGAMIVETDWTSGNQRRSNRRLKRAKAQSAARAKWMKIRQAAARR